MRKTILTYLILLASLCSAIAAQGETPNKCLQDINVMGHDSLRLLKLKELIEKSGKTLAQKQQYTDELLKEAQLQNNKRYIAQAYLFHVYSSFNQHDNKQLLYWTELLEPLARKEKFYDFLFKARQCVVESWILNSEFEQAEELSIQMIEEAEKLQQPDAIIAAKKSLATVYASTYRFDQAARYLEEALSLSAGINDPYSKLEILTYLISINKTLGNQPNRLKYLTLKEREIKQLIANAPTKEEEYKGELLMTYLAYLNYYIEADHKEKAKQYKELADQYLSTEYPVYQYNYYKASSAYYQYTRQWQEALDAARKTSELLKTLSMRNYPNALFQESEILYQMGQEKEALQVVKKVLSTKDTLQVALYNKQIDQIKGNYNANRELLTQMRINRYFQYSILALVLALIVTLSYFVYRYNRIKNHLTRSEREIRWIANEVWKVTQAKELFFSNMSYAIRSPLNKVVDLSLKLASNQPLENKQREEYGQTILSTSADLIKLLEEILDLSRLQAGRMKFTVSSTDVNMLVRNAIGCAASPNIQFISPFDEATILSVRIDGTRLMQVLQSLLAQAEEGNSITVELNKGSETTLLIKVAHTLFASRTADQDIIIRNEINRMIIEHFGGKYTIVENAIHFTLHNE